MPKRQRIAPDGIAVPEVKPSFPRFNDSYIPGAAARGARSQLDQLAEGLSQFNRGVTPFLSGLYKDKQEKDVKKGKELKQTGQPLPEDANDATKAGYEREAGYASAVDVRDRVLAEVAAMDEPPTLEEFNQMWEDASAEVGSETSPELLKSEEFRFAAADANTAFQQGESQNIARQQKESQRNEHSRMYGNNTKAFTADSILNRPDVTDAELMEEINARQQDVIDNGELTPKQATKETATALIDLAENGDRYGLSIEQRKRALKLAGEIQLGEGPLKFAKKYEDPQEEAWNAILRDEESEIGKTTADINRKARVAYDKVDAEYLELTTENQNAYISDSQWVKWERQAFEEGGAAARDDVRTLRQNHGKGYDDPQTIAHVQDRFMAGETNTATALEEIRKARISGKITVATATSMREEIEGFGPEGITNSDLTFYEGELRAFYILPLATGERPELADQQREMFLRAREVMFNHLRQPEVWEAYRAGSATTRRALERAAFENARNAVGEPIKS